MGSFAVQISKALGAEVTGVCSSRNLEMVRELGAHHAIGYTQEDFTQIGERYDLIFDAAAKRSFTACRAALPPGGVYITTAFSPLLALRALWQSRLSGKKSVPLPPKPPGRGDLLFLRQLLDSGKVVPMLDRTYPLAEAPAALHYLAQGHARGKIVILVGNAG